MSARRGWAGRAERLALAGMSGGLALMLLVPAPWAFRAGFFLVLGATVAEIVLGHLRASDA
jgi:hypothetical protein